MGTPLGIDLPGERPGLMPTRDWKRRVLGHGWALGETLVAGIGQGFILATPLQLATMVSRVATGRAVTPTLTRRPDAVASGAQLASSAYAADGDASAFPSLGLQPSWIATMHAGMNGVSNVPGGTAYGARIKEKEFALAGKTGSAQVKRITMAERASGVLKNEQRPWKDRDHALFVAFAPVDNPRYAIGMIVEHGGGGAVVAGPIARDILLEVQKRDTVHKAPSSSLAPLGPLPMPRDQT
jgi:penicillin-binding protein 2